MQVCRICLARDMELYDVGIRGLKAHFEAITNCLLEQDGFPEGVCWECRARLLTCARFREKALRSQVLLAAATLFQQCNVQQVECVDREEHDLTSRLRAATLVDHYDVELCWSVKEESECMVHEVEETIDTVHDLKEPIDTGYEVKEPLEAGHEVNKPIDTRHEVEEPIDSGHEVEEPEDTGHEVKSELELGPELMQSDFSFYHAQLSNQAEICESTGDDDDDKCAIHAVVEENASQTDIDESANCDEKNIRNLTCDNQAMSPKLVESGKVIYIKPDSEKHSTRTTAASKNSQHVMALYKANICFTCSRCGRVFNRRGTLLKHLMVHSGERPFTCSCGSKYIQKKHLERHIHHNGCQTVFTQEQVQHLENQQRYTVAQTVQNSAEHVKTNLVAFECDECGKSYHLKSELRKHILTHMLFEESLNVSEHTFSCTVCHNTFATKVVLSDHVKSQHPAHFETVQKCRLLLRQQKHTGEKRYKCDYCDYKAARKANLKQHVMCKHVNKKPFKCRHCESRFNLETNLRAHELVHTGEKPYKCRYCSFTSGHFSSVSTHQKLHSGDKPHKCGLCDYRAARKQNIKVHVMNVHTLEKPFKCDLCDYACRQKSQMKEHAVVHTSEKPYKCDVCSYACKRNTELKKHVKRHKSCS